MAAEKEIIYGQVVSKANNYEAVPGNDGPRRIIKNKKIRDYESAFCLQCRKYRNKKINVPFVLNIDVFFTDKRHDLDNAIKTVCDCLQYVEAISNDNLMMRLNARKFVVAFAPRVEFSIEELENTLF